jgi:hypothetical protein
LDVRQSNDQFIMVALTIYHQPQRQYSRRIFFAALAILLIIVLNWLHVAIPVTRLDELQQPVTPPSSPWQPIKSVLHLDSDHLACEDASEDLHDIVLVIKTGATESLRKLPVHFNTTLECWPHVLLLSDFNEEIEGHEVQDALDMVSDNIRQEDPSFDLWRRLHQEGRSTLAASDPEMDEQLHWGFAASERQEGWRLARFMNLPMAVKAQEFRPFAKWYVFIDADTFISWSNLLRLTRRLDHTKALYAGSQVPSAPGEFFAHGGSGYLLSQNALSAVVDHYLADQERWDTEAADGDFGEVPLARALLDINIELTWALPLFQGGEPHKMNFSSQEHGRKLWCYPAITYHHVTVPGITGLSQFEDEWVRKSKGGQYFHHSDVFKTWVLPQIAYGEREDWYNHSDDYLEYGVVSDAQECRAACEQRSDCVQYSFSDGWCKIGSTPKVGEARSGATSGWFLERVQEYTAGLDSYCEDLLLA